MSKLFFDHLVSLDKVEKEIKKIAESDEEKHEYFKLVDEIIHHRVMGCVFDKLPEKDHKKFIRKFKKRPHDESLLEYISKKAKEDLGLIIKYEIKKLEAEIIEWLLGTDDLKILPDGNSKKK